MATKIMPCDCVACEEVLVKQAGAKNDQCPKWKMHWMTRLLGVKFQDALYGIGMRLHNEMVKAGKKLGWRCTICGRVKLT
jgi:hypothetical protein